MSQPDGGDAHLAAAVAGGDEIAFRRLFDRYRERVRSAALRVLRDEVLAEDVVQDTFLSFWNRPQRFDPARGELRTFLVTIAHRRAVDIVRSEVARSRREQRPPDPVHIDVEEQVWSRELSQTVRMAMDDLTDDEREALSLAYFGGLSYAQVAERLGAPEGTVKSRIRSAMRKLSGSLADLARA